MDISGTSVKLPRCLKSVWRNKKENDSLSAAVYRELVLHNNHSYQSRLPQPLTSLYVRECVRPFRFFLTCVRACALAPPTQPVCVDG